MRFAIVVAVVAGLVVSAGCRHKKYDNPITKDTQQPDKVLFDSAIDDIEHARYEKARLLLQTLMNTYDTSEYLAKAKLAVADSWFREGGAHGYAQAEAEYKDFILFYPQMEEAAEAQEKICKMQYNQMDKADRDPTHARRAEDECRQLLVQFPNSKFAPEAQQYLRNIQEVLADAEYKVGNFYHTKGSYPAAANRFQGLTDHFPLYSGADQALMQEADSYQKMGDNFENQQAAAYSKLVKYYPLSSYANDAKSRLKAMDRPIPEADPEAYAREKYEQENRQKRSLLGTIWGPFSSHPNMTVAAKSGSPEMTTLHPTIPASVPAVAAGSETGTGGVTAGEGGGSDVSATTVGNSSDIDKKPDARLSASPTGGSGTTPAGAAENTPATPAKALPQNHTGKVKQLSPTQQLKQQQKLQEQQKKFAERQAKQQKKLQEEQAKKDRKKKKEEKPAATTTSNAAAGTATKQ
jgi:outer membrane protein assembly factor BamD